MQALKENQRRSRILLTKQGQAMDRALEDNETTLEEFETLLNVFRQRQTSLEAIHKEIQDLEENAEVDNTIDEQDKFMSLKNKVMYKVQKRIK